MPNSFYRYYRTHSPSLTFINPYDPTRLIKVYYANFYASFYSSYYTDYYVEYYARVLAVMAADDKADVSGAFPGLRTRATGEEHL